MTGFQGATAFVTGGGSGIGRALSIALAKRGARVHVTDVNGPSAEKVAQEAGNGATALQLDVRDAAAVKRAIDGAAAGGKLDYVFNNAGIGVGGEAQELTVAHWDRIIDVNIRGVVNGVAAAYPLMVRQGSGHIINTASLAGLTPVPLLTPYAMTKHAVVGLSTSLRAEGQAIGVRVSALCPAAIETPILDNMGPADLPRPKWLPNTRHFLTRAAGAPYPVEKLADETLEAVARNVGIIVIPRRARLAWRMYRFLPAVVEKLGQDLVAEARASRPPQA